MLDKIKQFEDAFDSRSTSLTAPAATANAPANTPPTSSSLADPRYDAQGTLKPVVSKKSDKPIAPYAVVDADGQPVCFISPSPGLNLNRYLNKQVGLYGRRGYLEGSKSRTSSPSGYRARQSIAISENAQHVGGVESSEMWRPLPGTKRAGSLVVGLIGTGVCSEVDGGGNAGGGTAVGVAGSTDKIGAGDSTTSSGTG